MKRSQIFSESFVVPLQVRDSRFGLRKLPMNKNESPTIATYAGPGKGPNGESQN